MKKKPQKFFIFIATLLLGFFISINFNFDREQACAISDMRMSAYTALEKAKIKKEIQEILMEM